MSKAIRRIGLGIMIFCIAFLLSVGKDVYAESSQKKELKAFLALLEKRCGGYGWTDLKPADLPWQSYRTTQQKRPLIFASFGSPKSDCTLFIGGVHGDELPTVHLMLKLGQFVKTNPVMFKDKYVIIAPLANPDGFFSKPPKRVNAAGIDINRNFPTKTWSTTAPREWKEKYGRNKRYYPGKKAGSERETMFQVALIKRFKPQKILSVHSPLNAYDFDGPSSDLDSFSHWVETVSQETNHPLKRFGFFPGSLGNYAGQERNIFTLTLELPTSDASKGNEYFRQFQPAILKFLNLPISATAPFLRITNYSKRQ